MARISVGIYKTKGGIRLTLKESCQYAENPEESEAVSIVIEALRRSSVEIGLRYGCCQLLEGDEIAFATEAREKKQREIWRLTDAMKNSSYTGSSTNRLNEI